MLKFNGAGLGALLLLHAGLGLAATVDLDYQGAAYSGYRAGTIYSNFNAAPGLDALRAGAGGFSMNVGIEDSALFSSGQSITAWCVDIHHALLTSTPQWVTYTVGDRTKLTGVFNTAKVDKLQKLVNQRYATIDTIDESAAFQLAIWEILFEEVASNSLNHAGGASFYASQFGPALALAENWLKLDGQNTGDYRITYLYDADRSDRVNSQNLITLTAVPLPAAAGLMLSALVVGGLVLRHRRKAD